MYAVGLNSYGGPEVLQWLELPDPQPAPGQVRIKVSAAGVNPVDVMLRDGLLAEWYAQAPKPYVPGMDIAGTIDALGGDLDPQLGLAVGQAVVGVVDNFGSYGGYSQYVCLPAASVLARPAGASFPAAASFLMNALTARNALDTLALPPGASVLVTGAAGAVGTYALALGASEGLRMIALASAADEAFLRANGASDVVPRGDDAATRVRQAIADGVDAVVDAACLGRQVAPAVRDGGLIITLRPGNIEGLARGVQSVFVNVRTRVTDHAAIHRLGEQVSSGLLALRVAATFPATQAEEAHRLFDRGGLRGRVVLDFDAATSQGR